MSVVISFGGEHQRCTNDVESALREILNSEPGIMMLISVAVYADESIREFKMHRDGGAGLTVVK